MGMEPRWEQMKGGQGQGNRKGGRLVLPALCPLWSQEQNSWLPAATGEGVTQPLGTVFGGRLGGAVVFIWQHLCKSYVQLAHSRGARSNLSLGLVELGMEDWLVIGLCSG